MTAPSGWRNLIAVHPAADAFHLLEGSELDSLVADIKTHGIRQPIAVMKDGNGGWQVIDGRNRLTAAEVAGVELFQPDGKLIWRYFNPVDGDSTFDPVGYVISSNLMRRHLNESQRAMVAAKLANLKEGRPSKSTAIAVVTAVPQAKAAALLNVSVDSVQRAAVVQREGSPELVRRVERGEVSVSAAAKSIKDAKPCDDQREQRELKRQNGKPPIGSEKSQADAVVALLRRIDRETTGINLAAAAAWFASHDATDAKTAATVAEHQLTALLNAVRGARRATAVAGDTIH